MKIINTKLEGVLKIEIDIFIDKRGKYIETYNEKLYKNTGIDVNFVQDDISCSKHNVLRGIHGDNKTWKLITCLHGEFYLVVLNNDKSTNQYGEWVAFNMSGNEYQQILIPPKFGNGHYIISDTAIFHYKQSTYYEPETQFSIKWDDEQFNIKWPAKNPILSDRDKGI